MLFWRVVLSTRRKTICCLGYVWDHSAHGRKSYMFIADMQKNAGRWMECVWSLPRGVGSLRSSHVLCLVPWLQIQTWRLVYTHAVRQVMVCHSRVRQMVYRRFSFCMLHNIFPTNPYKSNHLLRMAIEPKTFRFGGDYIPIIIWQGEPGSVGIRNDRPLESMNPKCWFPTIQGSPKKKLMCTMPTWTSWGFGKCKFHKRRFLSLFCILFAGPQEALPFF